MHIRTSIILFLYTYIHLYIEPITVFWLHIRINFHILRLLTVCKLLDDRKSFSKERNKNTQNCKLNAPRWAPVVVDEHIYIYSCVVLFRLRNFVL